MSQLPLEGLKVLDLSWGPVGGIATIWRLRGAIARALRDSLAAARGRATATRREDTDLSAKSVMREKLARNPGVRL